MAVNSQARANGLKAVEAVKAFMLTAKWKAEVVEQADDYHAYRVAFGDDFPVVGCFLEIYIDQQQFVSYLLFEPVVPEVHRAAVQEFVTRANHGMKIGNFEMDLDSGAVRYKSSVGFAGAELTEVLVVNAVMMALGSVRPYSAAFLGVVDGSQEPRAAIAAAES
jgi:hypothetical protein